MHLRSSLTGIVALTIHLTKKLLFSRKIMITLLAAAFVAIVMAYAGSQGSDSLSDGTDLMDILILFFFMPLMAMIYGASLIRDEIDDRSITHVATAPLDRAYSYLGYYVPLVVVVIVSMLIIETAGFVAFFSQHEIGAEAVEIHLEFSLLLMIGSVVYSSLFLVMSVMLKKPIFLGLFYVFVWEGIVGSLPGAIQKASVKHYLRSIGSEWVDYGSLSGFQDASTIGGSAAALLILTIAFVVLGALLFREAELS